MIEFAAPPGMDAVPPFDQGWVVADGEREAFLSYAGSEGANWSDHLERFHEESSRTHFLDVWTRDAIVASLRGLAPRATIADIGCSSGYLLADLRAGYPDATLVGIDLVASGLRRAHELVPSARLLQADACDLALADESVDAVVSANLLEHIADDRQALAEMLRIMHDGARAAIVVPFGAGTFDYYDRFLGHERRYRRGELAAKAREVGFAVLADRYVASLLYPLFWLVKQRNRRLYAHLEGEALELRVAGDIANTGSSRFGPAVRRIEERLRLRLPFGIRNLVVLLREKR